MEVLTFTDILGMNLEGKEGFEST